METIKYSSHASWRIRQRGFRTDEIDLVLACGTHLDRGCVLLRKKDAEREIKRRKQEIEALERLRGTKVVIRDDTVMTCYRSRLSDQKRILRRGREYK